MTCSRLLQAHDLKTDLAVRLEMMLHGRAGVTRPSAVGYRENR